ncbi:MAG: hypothetical protein FJY07_03370 [Bacteroidetes bacterium]|nr:hypothetical protein [Bacteroidota bacterium]
MKNLLLSLVVLLCAITGFSQQNQDAEQIKTCGNYLWGTGQGSSYQSADKNALDALITQISVQVQSSFENVVNETDGSLKEYTQSVVKTYSNVTLTEAKSLLVSEKKGTFEVIRYMAKTDLNTLFENRKQKIMEYVHSGLIAESGLRIGDALKNYYWSLVLLRSHKDNGTIGYNFPDEGNRLLITALPDRINAIFTSLNFSIKNIEDKPQENYKSIGLNLYYQGKPVENLDFVYWTGRNYSNPVSCRSGIGLAELIGEVEYPLPELKIRVEYAYQFKTGIDLEVRSVFENVGLPDFEKAEYKISLPPAVIQKAAQEVEKLSDIDFEKLNKVEQAQKIRKNLQQIIAAIEKKNYSNLENLFTDQGWTVFNQLIASGNVKVLPQDKNPGIIEIDDKTIVRSVPMKFSYTHSQRSFIEQVVFTFNMDLKIEAISFAISDKAIGDITSRSDNFGTVEDKYQLINFMEHYKTAYCLKRLDYIEKIFAENALIIVGSIIKEAEPIEGMYKKIGTERIKYIELNKGEYIGRLKKVFSSNEYVNIHFEENIVKKVNGDNKIYGIQIKQDYYSTNYADNGYLFLMIDLNDSINPKIYVRTWQPEKNPDGSIYGLNDFEIN